MGRPDLRVYHVSPGLESLWQPAVLSGFDVGAALVAARTIALPLRRNPDTTQPAALLLALRKGSAFPPHDFESLKMRACRRTGKLRAFRQAGGKAAHPNSMAFTALS